MGTKMNENGISTCTIPGTEKYTPFHPAHRPKNVYFQYDYKHTNGELFSCVASTLEECRSKRNLWLQTIK
ncbi:MULTISPECIES: DUF3873 family protein [Bacteroides]|uniref:DUF based on B. Theta Gene description n=1 Tax=Bacteroides uniformis TaxID=820 RepID=A0A174SE89_BACUN|nr:MULTISPECIES: DUF3873 family protein [Bacteroides]CUP93510.1 DUF based on B. Theta Gene description [Bacteroides uniformis]